MKYQFDALVLFLQKLIASTNPALMDTKEFEKIITTANSIDKNKFRMANEELRKIIDSMKGLKQTFVDVNQGLLWLYGQTIALPDSLDPFINALNRATTVSPQICSIKCTKHDIFLFPCLPELIR